MSVQLDSSSVDRSRMGPSTSFSSSKQEMTAMGRSEKDWRRKYLRALNICAPKVGFSKDEAWVDEARLKIRSRRKEGERAAISQTYGSYSELDNPVDPVEPTRTCTPVSIHSPVLPQREPTKTRTGSAKRKVRMRGHLRTESSSDAFIANGYGFQLRPNLSRGRRCHTDPFVLEERVSAPIEIPKPARDGALNHERSSNCVIDLRRSSEDRVTQVPAVQLLSWEEPIAMQAAAKALSAGLPIEHTNHMLGIDDSQKVVTDKYVHSDAGEEETSDSDGIFQMEELDDSDDSASCEETTSIIPPKARRERTVSASIVMGKPGDHRSSSFDRFKHESPELSASFVPPHQMVERDCFSLGLQNEFKRRPARI